MTEQDGLFPEDEVRPIVTAGDGVDRHPAAALMVVAEALRPHVRAGVEPLGAAVLALDALAAVAGAERAARPPEEPKEEQAARWLARACEHARYTGDGWRRLLESPGNVAHARAAANTRRRLTPVEAQDVAEVANLLERWHAQQATPQPPDA